MNAAGSNRVFFHEHTLPGDKAAVWALWTDVSTWKDWDTGLVDAERAGPSQMLTAVGDSGTVIAEGNRRLPFVVTAFAPGVSHTFETKLLLGGKLVITRTFPRPDTFRHDVALTGFGGVILSLVLGPAFRKSLPETMGKIATLAEQRA